MSSYHIQPLTGVPLPCKAQYSCPYGDILEDHYPSKEKAREAFELIMARYTFTAAAKDPIYDNLRDVIAEKAATLSDPDAQAYLRKVGEEVSAIKTAEETYRFLAHYENVREVERLEGNDTIARIADYASRLILRQQTMLEDARRLADIEERRLELIESLVEAKRDPSRPEAASFFESRIEAMERAIVRLKPGGEGYERNREEAISEANELSTLILEGKLESKFPTGHRLAYDDQEFVFIEADGEKKTVRELIMGTLSNRIVAGRGSYGPYDEARRIINENAHALIEAFSPEGSFVRPEVKKPRENKTVTDDFEFLGAGMENNAYLHKPTGIVYKLAHESSYNRMKSAHGLKDPVRAAIIQTQKKYAEVDDEKLAEAAVSYVKTHFLSIKDTQGNRVELIAQPYLSPDRYMPYEFDFSPNASVVKDAGVSDLHQGNCFLDMKTGEVVLIDCLF